MSYHIADIDGLDESLCADLARAGVRTTRHLLARWERETSREELMRLADGRANALVRLVGLADLLRVKGVGAAYARLLHEVGVRNASMLARTSATAVLTDMQAAKSRVSSAHRLPTLLDIERWIQDAADLPLVEGADGKAE